jgi:hypothetical protein
MMRVGRILRFTDRQKIERKWVRLSDVAERYGRERSTQEGYEKLIEAINAREFEAAGRSRLLYLHPGVCMAKMTRDKLDAVSRGIDRQLLISAYIEPCWIPVAMAERWFKKNKVAVVRSVAAAREARRGRPRGSRIYDDQRAVTIVAENIRNGYSSYDAAKAAIAELNLTVPSHGASQKAIINRLRTPGLSLARAKSWVAQN